MVKNDNLRSILFGYSQQPACGFSGEDGGFSVTVRRDGKLIYKTYLFPEEENTRAEYKLSPRSVSALKALMRRRQKVISRLDSNVYNGSFDGDGNFFIFRGKHITTWNISYTLPLFYPFLKEDLPVVRQENQILSLFFAARRILRRDDIDLTLDSVTFRKNGRRLIPKKESSE